ncbi:MAG TPA: antitoxin Xre/MbcA/ParS toxin-binding domain-containing protein [Gemmatimonadaceae bacterium]
MISSHAVAKVMGGAHVLKVTVRSAADLERLVASGLPVGVVEFTLAYVVEDPFTRKRVKNALVPPATLKRRKVVLSPEESARFERVARAMAVAESVWEDHADAQRFMTTPHPLLEGRAPIEVAETELGARRVEDVLAALEYALPV